MASSAIPQANGRSVVPYISRSKKLLLAAVGCVVGMVGFLAANQHGASNARQAGDHVRSHSVPIVLALQDMRFGVVRIAASTTELLLLQMTQENHEVRENIERGLVERGRRSFTDAMRRATRLHHDAHLQHGKDTALVAADLNTAFDAMIEVSQQLIALSRRGAGIEDMAVLMEDFEGKEEALLAHIDARLASEQRASESDLDRIVQRIEDMSRETMLMGLIALAVIAAYAHYGISLVKQLSVEVTHRKRTEDALNDANAELQRRIAELAVATRRADSANRAKSEFLANMSHELRTPLNAINGFSEMISSEMYGPVGSPKYLEYAHDINTSGEHLLALINDILDLSKIEAGKLELHEEVVDVSEVVQSCLVLVKERAEMAGVALECDGANGVATLYGNGRMLKQILINLLSNAVKFTPAGGRVSLKIWFRPNDGYVFQVADTGIGIAQDDIPRAMAPFKQIDSPLTRNYAGTGLGLPLTKSLIELHGGTIDLRSEPGVGTTVTARFPAERRVPEAVTGA